tara:strand:+ start:76 stop:393 length:318 start_codon:yes stop_codon:yes gene_type:complete
MINPPVLKNTLEEAKENWALQAPEEQEEQEPTKEQELTSYYAGYSRKQLVSQVVDYDIEVDELVEENKELESKLTKLQGVVDYLETKRLTQASTIEGLLKDINHG